MHSILHVFTILMIIVQRCIFQKLVDKHYKTVTVLLHLWQSIPHAFEFSVHVLFLIN